jgi:hypothetical protein
MPEHGAGADPEMGGDVLGRVSRTDELEDFGFAL